MIAFSGVIAATVLVTLAPLSIAHSAGDDPRPLLDPTDETSSLARAIAANELGTSLAAIEAQIVRGADRRPRARALPLVSALFDKPWSLPEVTAALADTTRCDRPALAVGRFAAHALGTEPPPPEGTGRQTIASAYHALQAIDYHLRGGDRFVQLAIAPIVGEPPGPGGQVPPGELSDDGEVVEEDQGTVAIREARAALAVDALALLATAERTPMPEGDDADRARRVADSSDKIDWTMMARAAALVDLDFEITVDWSKEEADALPAQLAGAVEGSVLAASYLPPVGWAVVGGPGANRYDMSVISAVFDPGGDDRYEWPRDAVGSRGILALEGDDNYVSRGAVGPGGALLGVGIIRDFKGNDRYEGTTLSSGAAMLGVGVVIDSEGDDIHHSRAFSQGAAIVGVGVLVDGGGSDRYEGEILCQGVGGPRGAGALIDRSGNDLYLAHGAPSAYGTPATFRSFSQGVGYGVRRDLPGGIGLLVDDAGDDRYEGGEFSQGGGYFLSLGALVDRSGRDLYRGDRYAQGFAAHQAFGALIDHEGDDMYWSRTAAGQGAAWDESVAMLIDRTGNDRYRADGLSQGAAAQQAIGVLVDLDGDDTFDAVGASVQGAGGSNEYRFADCNCYSLGVLLKRGGTARYSSGRPADAVTFSAVLKPGDPQGSAAFGLLIDEGPRGSGRSP